MQLEELRSLLTASTKAHWSKIATGPLYREGYTVYGMGGESSMSVRWHYEAAVYRSDVDLTLQWGMDLYSDRGNADLSFDWAQGFIDQKSGPSSWTCSGVGCW